MAKPTKDFITPIAFVCIALFVVLYSTIEAIKIPIVVSQKFEYRVGCSYVFSDGSYLSLQKCYYNIGDTLK